MELLLDPLPVALAAEPNGWALRPARPAVQNGAGQVREARLAGAVQKRQ